MTRTIALLVSMAVLLAAAACSDGGTRLVAGDGSRPSGEPPTSDPALTPGGGPGGLVVSIEVGGGFAPVGHDFRAVPSAVVYEDGTTFSAGPYLMVFPGPAAHPVVRGEIDRAEVAALVSAAAEAGLLDGEPADLGEPPVADAPATTVTVVVDGKQHVTSVYALHEVDARTPGMTAGQVAARRAVAAFVDKATRVVTEGEVEHHVADRYRVMPLPASAEPTDGDAGAERDWPLPHVQLAEGRCSAVTGDDAATLRQAIDEAHELTRWRTPTGVHTLSVRPVLPHEPDCPA